MKWLTTNTEYDGSPLYLRFPGYDNIWKHKEGYPNLLCISHILDNVKDNGLPTSEYNKSLFGFDGEVIDLFQTDKLGIVILVETYGGVRNYWFYIIESKAYISKYDNLKLKHSDKQLELVLTKDLKWDFIKDYPIKLYNL